MKWESNTGDGDDDEEEDVNEKEVGEKIECRNVGHRTWERF